MSQRPNVTIPDAGMLATPRTRRDILKLIAVGGTLVLLPAALAACSDDNGVKPPTQPLPNSGSALTIDFAKGDIAVLQFAYALEQLEADFYTKAVNAFGSSNLTAAEKAVLQDIKYHEVLHREFLKAALGPTNDFTVVATYPSVNFNDRTSVLTAAKTFEDLGVAAYNGAAQYITSAVNLTLAGKIVSVEARHASAISDLLSPKTSAFAPKAFDDVFRPSMVATAAQGFIVNKLGFANAPSTFVQGPNNNG
ncbi:ferritin-like domain-containing protein [Gemmatimonas sp.]|uniref:ferritin-like domain-containing protein n=1 Tax=Gemmatimonas sp. TaxID=1962908 RepID=UPI0039838385